LSPGSISSVPNGSTGESALARYKKIDLVVCTYNDPPFHEAYLAAATAGREKENILVGSDALPQAARLCQAWTHGGEF